MGEKVEACISIRTTRCHFYFYIPDAPLLITRSTSFTSGPLNLLWGIFHRCVKQVRSVVPFAASS